MSKNMNAKNDINMNMKSPASNEVCHKPKPALANTHEKKLGTILFRNFIP